MKSFFAYSKIHENYFKERGEKISYKKNQYLVWRNDDSPWVFFLIEGTIKISCSLSDGSSRLVGYFIPGMTFAKSGSFFSDSGGNLEYTADSPATVYRVPREEFLLKIKQDPVLAQEYMNMLLKNQIFLVDRIIYQGEKTVRLKLLRWLLFMTKYYSNENCNPCTIEIPLTQDTIANFLHVTRESVSTLLNQFESEKLISVKKKKITITDVDKIKKLLK